MTSTYREAKVVGVHNCLSRKISKAERRRSHKKVRQTLARRLEKQGD